jgi:hypothetical protein
MSEMKKLLLALLALFATPAPAAVAIQVSPDVLAALQLCPVDSLYHFKTSACPLPAAVPSPSLAGAAYISDGTDGSQALQPSWGSGAIPPSSKPDGVDIPANRSGYWMPAMLDANGNPTKLAFAIIYYKRRPITDPKCSIANFQAEGNCLTIPNGLRFIFGYDMLTGKSPTGSLWFNCQGPGAVPGHYSDLTQALANCPTGALVGAVIEAPSCWDGKNLDTPNHRDHVAYPGYGSWGYLRCPLDHPYVIPSFTLGAWFPVVAGMHLSCDAMVPGKPAGTCFHTDYWEAWNDKVKAMWTQNDIDKMLNASGGDLGNGKQLKLRGSQ